MELIDTPNPNAKKLLFNQKSDDISESLEKVEGISSVCSSNNIFFAFGFGVSINSIIKIYFNINIINI